jgi:hypothetical protein
MGLGERFGEGMSERSNEVARNAPRSNVFWYFCTHKSTVIILIVFAITAK